MVSVTVYNVWSTGYVFVLYVGRYTYMVRVYMNVRCEYTYVVCCVCVV